MKTNKYKILQFKKKKNRKPNSMPYTFSGGIICGPIWGSYPVWGSFAVGDLAALYRPLFQ